LQTKIKQNGKSVPLSTSRRVAVTAAYTVAIPLAYHSQSIWEMRDTWLPSSVCVDAYSCIVIALGGSISKYELFDTYMAAYHKLPSVKLVDPMQRNAMQSLGHLSKNAKASYLQKLMHRNQLKVLTDETVNIYKFWTEIG
jgi:hypothetical protein